MYLIFGTVIDGCDRLLYAQPKVCPGLVPAFSMTEDPSGWIVATVRDARFLFRCDTKEYAIKDGLTISCLRVSPKEMITSIRARGKRIIQTERTLDASGFVVTDDSVYYNKGGSETKKQTTYYRAKAQRGFDGEWFLKDPRRCK
jgi:hypothetical protein